jgi:glycosyltransferase involved in cell wall biosynthesis
VHAGFGPDDDGLLQLYQNADILAVPTLADCFSLAAIEAMACGLPVITTAVGGIPEIVMDGETGFLVAPGDPQQTLDAIRMLVADAALRRRLGQAGREVASLRFNASTQAQLTLQIMLTAGAAEAQSPATVGVT